MKLPPGAEIKCPLSVLERVRIREVFFKKKCMRILSVYGKLSVIERCPHGEVRLYIKNSSVPSHSQTSQSLLKKYSAARWSTVSSTPFSKPGNLTKVLFFGETPQMLEDNTSRNAWFVNDFQKIVQRKLSQTNNTLKYHKGQLKMLQFIWLLKGDRLNFLH